MTLRGLSFILAVLCCTPQNTRLMKTFKLPLPAEERDLVGRIEHSHPGEPGAKLRLAEWLVDLRQTKNVRLDLLADAAGVSHSTMRGLVTGRAIALQGVLTLVHAVRRHNAGQLDLLGGAPPPLVAVAPKKKARSAVRNSTKKVPHRTKKKGGPKS